MAGQKAPTLGVDVSPVSAGGRTGGSRPATVNKTLRAERVSFAASVSAQTDSVTETQVDVAADPQRQHLRQADICYIQTAVTDSTPWQVRAYWESDPRSQITRQQTRTSLTRSSRHIARLGTGRRTSPKPRGGPSWSGKPRSWSSRSTPSRTVESEERNRVALGLFENGDEYGKPACVHPGITRTTFGPRSPEASTITSKVAGRNGSL